MQRPVLRQPSPVRQAFEEGAFALLSCFEPLGLPGRRVALNLVHTLAQAGEHPIGAKQIVLLRKGAKSARWRVSSAATSTFRASSWVSVMRPLR